MFSKQDTEYWVFQPSKSLKNADLFLTAIRLKYFKIWSYKYLILHEFSGLNCTIHLNLSADKKGTHKIHSKIQLTRPNKLKYTSFSKIYITIYFQDRIRKCQHQHKIEILTAAWYSTRGELVTKTTNNQAGVYALNALNPHLCYRFNNALCVQNIKYIQNLMYTIIT